jgi:hypothetical protein
MPRRPIACIALLAAACAPEPGAPPPPTAATLAAPAPRLAETARFDAALSAATPDAERLAADADALAARAEALRARADALAQPVMAEEARQRLEAPRP